MIYKIKQITRQGDIIFILLNGDAPSIREGSRVKDENGNVFSVKAVMSICTGCTMCSDTMLNTRMEAKKGEIGTIISGGII